MSNQLKYIVMGDDGREYGPVSADQIHDWIRENRLERKTPVKPDDAKDWVFLEMLPEFLDALNSARPATPGRRSSRKWMIIFLLLLLAGAVILVWKQYKHY